MKMKKNLAVISICLLSLGISSCNNHSSNNQTEITMDKTTKVQEPILGLGSPITDNFTGAAWLERLSSQPEYDCNVYNVTFAPGTRNYWHSHSVGQILLCTEGVGYYQERDKPAQRLQPGDIVNIPSHTAHWHGAAPDNRFTHIGITPKVNENATEWLGEVTDEEYAEAVK